MGTIKFSIDDLDAEVAKHLQSPGAVPGVKPNLNDILKNALGKK